MASERLNFTGTSYEGPCWQAQASRFGVMALAQRTAAWWAQFELHRPNPVQPEILVWWQAYTALLDLKLAMNRDQAGLKADPADPAGAVDDDRRVRREIELCYADVKGLHYAVGAT